jgi:hypothetical protein
MLLVEMAMLLVEMAMLLVEMAMLLVEMAMLLVEMAMLLVEMAMLLVEMAVLQESLVWRAILVRLIGPLVQQEGLQEHLSAKLEVLLVTRVPQVVLVRREGPVGRSLVEREQVGHLSAKLEVLLVTRVPQVVLVRREGPVGRLLVEREQVGHLLAKLEVLEPPVRLKSGVSSPRVQVALSRARSVLGPVPLRVQLKRQPEQLVSLRVQLPTIPQTRRVQTPMIPQARQVQAALSRARSVPGPVPLRVQLKRQPEQLVSLRVQLPTIPQARQVQLPMILQVRRVQLPMILQAQRVLALVRVV